MTERGDLRLAVLLSGGGRTLQNFLDRIAAGTFAARVVLVVSDRADAGGLERARRVGIPHVVEKDPTRIFERVRASRAELVCLAGYLRLLAPIPDDFVGRVLNIHPALLPKHGGKGFYGDHVHRAVLSSRDAESGCTVHVCDDEYDRGRILQQSVVPVLPDDDVHRLAARVFAAECETYPRAIMELGASLDRSAATCPDQSTS